MCPLYSLFNLLPFILALWPSRWLMAKFLHFVTKGEKEKLKTAEDTLPLGSWIGVFERWIAIFLILQGQVQAVAFIVAAKGLLRFPDLRSANDSPRDNYSLSSYILLGTLASLFLAIFLAEAWLWIKCAYLSACCSCP